VKFKNLFNGGGFMKKLFMVEVSSFRKEDMEFHANAYEMLYDNEEDARKDFESQDLASYFPGKNDFMEKFLAICTCDEDDIDCEFPCDSSDFRKLYDFNLEEWIDSERYYGEDDNEDV
jgi:hypothetical protein